MPKTADKVRLPNGQFAKKEDVLPAMFKSNRPGYICVMDSTIAGEHIGKRLKFKAKGDCGIYETKDTDEIEFLEKRARTAGPIIKLEKKRDLQLKEEAKEKARKTKKQKGDK